MKSKAANLDYMQTAESRRRVIPNLKKLYSIVERPGIISLAGGTPNASIFPFDGVGSTSLAPPFANGIAEPKMDSKNQLSYRIFEQNKDDTSEDGGDIELASALQYGIASGDGRILDFLKEHINRVHDIGFTDWDIGLTVGNTFAWDAVLRTFCEPTDTILFEEFTFPSALENAQTRGCDTIGVKMDEFGIVLEDLEAMAQRYRPKLLYTIPTGQNPTGVVLPAERRRKIMEIARKYDFLVVEDEPYYYLQMDELDLKSNNVFVNNKKKSRSDFIKSLVPTLLHYDTDGRVIRLDSFSKIMAPGIRMGWIVAQQRFTDAIRKTTESSSSKPSGFAQTLVYGLMRRWGQDGFIDWLMGLRDEYTERRNLCCQKLYDLLKNNKRVHIVTPKAGMFFWLQVKTEGDPQEEEEAFFQHAAEANKVVVVPGHWCKVNRNEVDTSMFFRGTYASESKDSIVEGVNRLADAISEYTATVQEPFVLVHS